MDTWHQARAAVGRCPRGGLEPYEKGRTRTSCHGPAVCPTLSITVDFVLKFLGDGYIAIDIVPECPGLEVEDAHPVARYGTWLATEGTSAIG